MEKEKIYKSVNVDNNNIYPGNPQGLPDESFQGKIFKPERIVNNIQVPGMARKGNAGLPIPSEEHRKKAIVFVDANNWYHNVKLLFKPSNISIAKVSNLICRNLKLDLREIRWYASIPDIADGEKEYFDHMHFLSILEKEGIKVISRKLQRLSNKEILKKKRDTIDNLDLCEDCRAIIEASFLDLADIKRKEKGIDVWVAIDMVKKSIVDKDCDVCILISGDSDFVPAVNLIKQAGKKVLSAFVPFGYSSELRKSTEYFIIRKETLIKCFRDYEKRIEVRDGKEVKNKNE
ncbi:MAG: NYN domain-containing protein [Nanoarchaeota archaeon]|nr:NYN domain-containing protein [Nanoarchaeota archaeon]